MLLLNFFTIKILSCKFVRFEVKFVVTQTIFYPFIQFEFGQMDGFDGILSGVLEISLA